MSQSRGISKPFQSASSKFDADSSLTTESEWMDSDEAATYLRISPFQLRNLTSNGRVPFYKFGRSNRYLRKELRELLLGQPRGGSNGC
jgi:excisionase family DNA binding protein